jgi:hypothetical protein
MSTDSVNTFFSELEGMDGYDFVLGVVPEALVEEAFPNAQRVVARFTDHQVFPGELYALSPSAIARGQEVIAELSRRRRVKDRQGKRIGLRSVLRFLGRRPRTWPLILKFLLKRARLEDGERVFCLAFDCRAKAVIVPDPGFGMDMDLPEDYEKLERYVKRTKMPA